MKFNKQEIIRLWGNGLNIMVNYRNYKVNKMSYGQYFLEPKEWNGGEKDGFSPKTIWLKEDETNKNILITTKEELN